MGFALLACAPSNETKIRDACVNASAQSGRLVTRQDYRACTCFATSAKRNLDKDDFALLARVSTIYLAKEDDEVKAHDMVNVFRDSGMTPTRAGLLAMDFLYLVHRLDRECRR